MLEMGPYFMAWEEMMSNKMLSQNARTHSSSLKKSLHSLYCFMQVPSKSYFALSHQPWPRPVIFVRVYSHEPVSTKLPTPLWDCTWGHQHVRACWHKQFYERPRWNLFAVSRSWGGFLFKPVGEGLTFQNVSSYVFCQNAWMDSCREQLSSNIESLTQSTHTQHKTVLVTWGVRLPVRIRVRTSFSALN